MCIAKRPLDMRNKIARPIGSDGRVSIRLVYDPKLDRLSVSPKKDDEKRK